MNASLEELKQFSVLHARAQGLSRSYCKTVLGRISEPFGIGKSTWGFEWHQEAQSLFLSGNHKEALRCAIMGRFPYPCDAERYRCDQFSRQIFKSLRGEYGNFQDLIVKSPQGNFTAYVTDSIWNKKTSLKGVDPGKNLILAIGGIVSPKEQWGQFLGFSKILNTQMAVVEMPGVGENYIQYAPDSYKMFASLIDALNIESDTNVHVIAMSFGGHSALRYATNDHRIKSITTVGAPIRDFFLTGVHSCPDLTRDILSHLIGAQDEKLVEILKLFAISDMDLFSVNARINYMRCGSDEIIPSSDYDIALEACRYFYGRHTEDVHGAPNNVKATQFWVMKNLSSATKSRRIHIMSTLLQKLFDAKSVLTFQRQGF